MAKNMKKTWTILMGCALLCGCVGYEADLQDAQKERDAMLLQKRMKEGCTFVRDQDAYRECLLNTYYSQYPKGYQTAELVDGEPIAVISNSNTGYMQNQYATTQVAPLPAIASPQIVPYSTTEVTTTDTTFTQEYVTPQATVVQTREVVAQVPVEAPLPEPENVVRTVAMPEPVQQPVVQQDPTWWDNYQQNRTVVQPTVKCPCDDPNDPCPQCYEK